MMLDDPNSVLRNHIATQKIVAATAISVSTQPVALTTEIAPTNRLKDETVNMAATFWIEAVQGEDPGTHLQARPTTADH